MQALGLVRISKNMKSTIFETERVPAEWRGTKLQRVGIDRLRIDLEWEVSGRVFT